MIETFNDGACLTLGISGVVLLLPYEVYTVWRYKQYQNKFYFQQRHSIILLCSLVVRFFIAITAVLLPWLVVFNKAKPNYAPFSIPYRINTSLWIFEISLL